MSKENFTKEELEAIRIDALRSIELFYGDSETRNSIIKKIM
jgi:hypothetical protein